jgi:hypothetical protein
VKSILDAILQSRTYLEGQKKQAHEKPSLTVSSIISKEFITRKHIATLRQAYESTNRTTHSPCALAMREDKYCSRKGVAAFIRVPWSRAERCQDGGLAGVAFRRRWELNCGGPPCAACGLLEGAADASRRPSAVSKQRVRTRLRLPRVIRGIYAEWSREGGGKGAARHDLLDTTYLARLKITAQKHMK